MILIIDLLRDCFIVRSIPSFLGTSLTMTLPVLSLRVITKQSKNYLSEISTHYNKLFYIIFFSILFLTLQPLNANNHCFSIKKVITSEHLKHAGITRKKIFEVVFNGNKKSKSMMYQDVTDLLDAGRLKKKDGARITWVE